MLTLRQCNECLHDMNCILQRELQESKEYTKYLLYGCLFVGFYYLHT